MVPCVESIEGSEESVRGMPMGLFRALLAEVATTKNIKEGQEGQGVPLGNGPAVV